MDTYTLREKVDTLHRLNRQLDNYVKHLTRKNPPYRGSLTPKQLQHMKRLLKGHTIDAARAVDFYPPAFLDEHGRVDEPALIWWLEHNRARWQP